MDKKYLICLNTLMKVGMVIKTYLSQIVTKLSENNLYKEYLRYKEEKRFIKFLESTTGPNGRLVIGGTGKILYQKGRYFWEK